MRGSKLRGLAVTAAVGLLTAVLTAMPATTAPVDEAVAANAANFNPGNIVSDAVFYNSRTMSVDQIQAFLNARVPACADGYTCLKDYWETTRSQPVRVEGCAAYAGQSESAARIIYKVATACGINPQSLLALLEKEQGLVTDSTPTTRQYRSATGYGCPDTADCDINYYGFFNQVYNAAWQFKKYRAYPTIRAYQAGRWNTILWHPNTACGSSQVYIQNQATAGLYIYTPYRPNAAALANLYGTGDSCSSYGNRNFWRIFTDWFGSTTIAVHPVLNDAWVANGGATGSRLGAPTATATLISDGGVMQRFEHGWLMWRSDIGAKRLTGATASWYFAKGGALGGLGYPITDVAGLDAIEHVQDFQFGRLSWKPDVGVTQLGGYRMSNAVYTNWRALGGPAGVLGYPAAALVSEGSGWSSQRFDRGRLLYDGNAKIMYWLPTATWDFWKARGGLTGSIGTPVTSPSGSAAGGWSQDFTRARLATTSAGIVSFTAGADPVTGVWATNWNALKGASGVLGYSLGPVVGEGSNWSSQRFERGRLLFDGNRSIMYWLPTSTWDFWKAQGGLSGRIGAPVESPAGSPSSGWTQDFVTARVATPVSGTPTIVAGGYAVTGVWATNWNALKARSQDLGYPTGNIVDEGSGWKSQGFERGRLLLDGNRSIMYWLPNATWDFWKSRGGLTGSIGAPTTSPTGSATTGWTQRFTSGGLATSPTGVVTIIP
ncbi:LGFP repeat-containing protein [Agromyces bauzanensis]